MNSLVIALECAARGWSVFPVKTNEKIPACRWTEVSTTDPDKIARLFDDPISNVGIDCGKSGLLVVDVDDNESFYGYCADNDVKVGVTFKVRTPRGGVHLYFKGIEHGNGRGALPEGVDVRGDGGYVLASGSEIDGKAYQVLRRAHVRDVPEWIETALKTRKRGRGRPRPGEVYVQDPPTAEQNIAKLKYLPEEELVARINGVLAKVAFAPDGSRNSLLYWASCRLGEVIAAERVEPEVAKRHLLIAASDCGLMSDNGEDACQATIESGFRQSGWPE